MSMLTWVTCHPTLAWFGKEKVCAYSSGSSKADFPARASLCFIFPREWWGEKFAFLTVDQLPPCSHIIYFSWSELEPNPLLSSSGAGTLFAAIPIHSSLVVATVFRGKLCGASRAVPVGTRLAQPWGVELGVGHQPFRSGGCINEVAREDIQKIPSSVLLSVQVPHSLPRVGILEAAEESMPRACPAVMCFVGK